MRKREVFEHPVAKRTELVVAGLWSKLFDELSLSSLSLRRSYECACAGGVGRWGADHCDASQTLQFPDTRRSKPLTLVWVRARGSRCACETWQPNRSVVR